LLTQCTSLYFYDYFLLWNLEYQGLKPPQTGNQEAVEIMRKRWESKSSDSRVGKRNRQLLAVADDRTGAVET
jgi:hypothetical protein